MAKSVLNGVKISGMCSAVPIRRDSVYYFLKDVGEDNIEKFVATTGVKERRHVCGCQTNSDLCYVAAERIIAYKGYSKDSFDAIVLVTQSPDYAKPATAHILHKRLGFPIDCMAFDINLGCSGFVYAVNVCVSMILGGGLRRVLLCCGETHNEKQCAENDKASYMLFGDAGSAIILEKGNDEIDTLLKSDGNGYNMILMAGVNARIPVDFDNPNFNYGKIRETMDGPAVFEFAIKQVPKCFKDFFTEFGGNIDDYDYCVFHQANLFMLKHIAKKIKLSPDKMPVSMDRYGNTSSVSIPLTICDLIARQDVPDRIRFITCGFGIGLSWGIATFEMDKNDILPIIETDDYFKEAYVG